MGAGALTCGSKDRARRCVGLVPVVLAVGRVWVHKRCLRGMLDGAQRWRQINSEHEEGADAKAQKRRDWRFSHLGITGLNRHCGGSTSKPQEN